MSFERWVIEVNHLCERRLCATWSDLVGDAEPLVRGFDSGQTPTEFIDWLIEKYGLTDIEDFQRFGMGAAVAHVPRR